MARIRGKKALYEVIGKSSLPGPAPSTPPPAPPEETGVDESESPVAQPTVTAWPRKPRILQINAGRIEFSLPYQIAIAVLLGLVLLFLVVYRLGQMSYPSAAVDDNPVIGSTETGKTEPPRAVTPPSVVPLSPTAEAPATTGTGNNAIVIMEYATKRDLEPVQAHFRKYGIETEIVPAPRGRYFLRTKERYRYDKIGDGSQCDKDRQKIVTIGAMYKAERGYETFGAQSFQTAYPMKVD
jgi:hypothetical protein